MKLWEASLVAGGATWYEGGCGRGGKC